MSATRLVGIPAPVLPDAWERVQPMLQSIADRSSGKYRVGDLARAIVARDFQLWAAAREGEIIGAGLTEIVNFPQRRVCRFFGASGHDHDAWMPLLEGIEEWARQQGATSLEPLARRGWAPSLRSCGYRPTHTLFEKDL